MLNRLNKFLKKQLSFPKDPRYVFIIIGSLILFALCFLQVRNEGLFDSVERPVFEYFNSLPSNLYDIMLAVTQFGGLGGLLIWVPLAWYLINRRAALLIGLTGMSAWFLAKVAKEVAQRERPGNLLTDVHLFSGETLGGYGFPSGHATFAAACSIFLYFQIAPKYRKYLLLVALSVGVSRMYLGAHFPLDIVGGWALGSLIGATFCIVFGISSKDISISSLKKFLINKGLPITSLKFADVDARGSRPVFMVTEANEEYFGKLFGKKEHAADWLFKIFRFFRYKNLQGEEPHFSSRRNVEIEAFSMLWAKQAGVRVPKLIDILNYGSYWMSIQEKIDAKPLSDHGRLKNESLIDAWKQVKKLHSARIAHRDLRAANIMVDKKGNAWLIDFGFAEASASNKRLAMDRAELLMSTSLVVGSKRAFLSAKTVLNHQEMKGILPYLQTAVFSGETTKQLKQNMHLLGEIRDLISVELKIKDEVDEANIIRLNGRKAINIILVSVFIYFITPQIGEFANALSGTRIENYLWLLPLTLASFSTYLFAGLIYVALADVPLKLRQATLVQIASSFVSKIMPGGIASTALNAKYMIKAGLSPLEATGVLSSQAFIGFIMFIVPLGLFLILNGTNLADLIDLPLDSRILFIGLSTLTVLAAIVLSVSKVRASMYQKATSFIAGIRDISIPPKEVFIASVSSLGVTAAYILCLYLSLQAVGLSLGITAVVLAYATAVIAKSAVPTPGGLGPVEAALIATLIALGSDKESVISGVLIYRLATFWIPIPFSLLAYQYISRKKLI